MNKFKDNTEILQKLSTGIGEFLFSDVKHLRDLKEDEINALHKLDYHLTQARLLLIELGIENINLYDKIPMKWSFDSDRLLYQSENNINNALSNLREEAKKVGLLPVDFSKRILVVDINYLPNTENKSEKDLKEGLEKEYNVKVLFADFSKQNIQGLQPQKAIYLL